jgi:hypothetical protein
MGISRPLLLWGLAIIFALGSTGEALARGGGSHGGSSHSSGSHSSGSSGTGSNPSSHYTKGYTTKSGTYVQPHQQTNPNGTTRDNYGTRGNVNPYTGKVGTKSPKD